MIRVWVWIERQGVARTPGVRAPRRHADWRHRNRAVKMKLPSRPDVGRRTPLVVIASFGSGKWGQDRVCWRAEHARNWQRGRGAGRCLGEFGSGPASQDEQVVDVAVHLRVGARKHSRVRRRGVRRLRRRRCWRWEGWGFRREDGDAPEVEGAAVGPVRKELEGGGSALDVGAAEQTPAGEGAPHLAVQAVIEYVFNRSRPPLLFHSFLPGCERDASAVPSHGRFPSALRVEAKRESSLYRYSKWQANLGRGSAEELDVVPLREDSQELNSDVLSHQRQFYVSQSDDVSCVPSPLSDHAQLLVPRLQRPHLPHSVCRARPERKVFRARITPDP
eukprot:2515633-Rhodomonas_salina.2